MRIPAPQVPRVPAFLAGAVAVAAVLAPSASPAPPAKEHLVVGFRSESALAAALRRYPGAQIVRRVPHMKTVEIELRGEAQDLSGLPGIAFSHRPLRRTTKVEPALAAVLRPGLPYEWQYVATRVNEVPEPVLRAASGIKIAVIDTGVDLSHPDLAAKAAETWDIVHRRASVADRNGHGTFVSSLAAGSTTNEEGIAGFAGDASLLMVKAVGKDDSFSDVDEAAAIVYAVDHGAKIINLSIGGVGTSRLEQRAIEYAAGHNVLLVAAAGNEYQEGNPVEYPAAALQPVGSRGQGGFGLAVGASTISGRRAEFSNTGSHISLAAPGERVFGDIAATSPRSWWPRSRLPGSAAGLYGWASGTSFSSPETAGAAALVWAANPALTAQEVAGILKATASGHGRWNPRLGWGVIDVAAAVATASGQQVAPRVQAASWLSVHRSRSRSARRAGAARRLRRVRLTAHLRTTKPGVTPDDRIVSLELRWRRRWHRVGRTQTRLGGGARWSLGLPRGRYLFRVVYRGRWDLRGAVRLMRVRIS
jgi:Subtilase family